MYCNFGLSDTYQDNYLVNREYITGTSAFQQKCYTSLFTLSLKVHVATNTEAMYLDRKREAKLKKTPKLQISS